MEKNFRIHCETNERNQAQVNFYITTPQGRYYLFTNKVWESVLDFYRNGKILSTAIDMGKTNNKHVRKVMEKLPKYIKYIESLEGITVLEKTQKKQSQSRGSYIPKVTALLYE